LPKIVPLKINLNLDQGQLHPKDGCRYTYTIHLNPKLWVYILRVGVGVGVGVKYTRQGVWGIAVPDLDTRLKI
jgi:hypothetical protein